jgi:transcription initiation factor TFIIIB Brf1 subunit/transcription initiation factor TFIIB
MNSLPKVIGYVHIPDAPKKHKCTCDDCGCQLDDSCGDPRVEVKRFDSKDAKEPSSVRWICEYCADEQFGDHEPNSIFG